MRLRSTHHSAQRHRPHLANSMLYDATKRIIFNYDESLNHSKTNQSSVSSSMVQSSIRPKSPSAFGNIFFDQSQSASCLKDFGGYFTMFNCVTNKMAAPTPRTTNKDLGGGQSQPPFGVYKTIYLLCIQSAVV